jgi:cytochrome c oxidase subunit 2
MIIRRLRNQIGLVAILASLLLVGRLIAKDAQPADQVIRINAAGFQFQPGEITVKKGVPVTLELTSVDRHHGFKLPDFHLRADVMPGVVEKIRFVPDKVGKFTFMCDVFCGDGHEDMSGILNVID